MKQFITVVFGGLLLIFGIIALALFVRNVWNKYATDSNSATLDILRRATSTEISGFSKIIKYTASEEEDIIDQVMHITSGSRPDVTAKSYFIKDLTDGKVWSQYEEERLLPIASITKLITAVVANNLIRDDVHISVSNNIINTYGNTAGFKSGENFTIQEMLHPLLLVSSNDAAEALAQHYGRKAFIKEMNNFVQSIGAYKTYFADPTGLSSKNVSTAKDVSIIMEWIYEHEPEIIKITTQKRVSVREHVWNNPTHFLSWSYYEGGKNGFTDEARKTSVSLFRVGYNKHLYCIVVLGSESRDQDVMGLMSKIK